PDPHHEDARREHLDHQQAETGHQPDDPAAHAVGPGPQGPEAGGGPLTGGIGGGIGPGGSGGGGSGVPAGGGASSPRSNCMACTMPPARALLSIGTTTSRVFGADASAWNART